MEVYGVVLQFCHLLTRYWYNETMVERERGYHRDPFRGFGVSPMGDPLSPHLFNFVVDRIICH